MVFGTSVRLTVVQQGNLSYVLGHGGKFSFRRALAGLRCSCLPQADGTATLHNAVIDLIARTMPYSAALGNRPRDVGEGLLGCMFQAPYPIEQLRGAS